MAAGTSASSTLRLTPQRQAVLEVVRDGGAHLTADAIRQAVQLRFPGVGVATIYRALETLTQTGHVVALRLPGESGTRFDGRTARHHHLVCSGCGEVTDVDIAVPSQVLTAAAKQADAVVESYDLQFRGKCRACRG